jgi:hypothetical protein
MAADENVKVVWVRRVCREQYKQSLCCNFSRQESSTSVHFRSPRRPLRDSYPEPASASRSERFPAISHYLSPFLKTHHDYNPADVKLTIWCSVSVTSAFRRSEDQADHGSELRWDNVRQRNHWGHQAFKGSWLDEYPAAPVWQRAHASLPSMPFVLRANGRKSRTRE